jgi:lipopolysaccharide export system protein LptC
VAGIQGISRQDGSAPAVRSRAFTKARRHSRWVRFAKIAIPVGSLLGMTAVGVVAYYNPFRNIEGLTIGNIGVSGTNVTMESPKLTGFKSDKRPYEVTASAATQDIRKPNIVQLKDLRARIVTDDRGGVARLEADTGVLDTQRERMRLRQNIRVTTEAGQEVKLRTASVDFKAGTVKSDSKVVVSLGNGVIHANGLTVTENGSIMQFKGRVRTVFQRSALPRPATASASADTGSEIPASETPAAQPTSVRP